MLYISAFSDVKCSHGLVWVEHDSDGGSHGSWWEVLGEVTSHSTGMSVGSDDLSPLDSISSVVYGVLGLVDVGNSLSEVPSGSSKIGTVLNVNDSLLLALGGLSSSESGEHSLLVQSDWLGLVVRLLLGGFDFLCHLLFL